MLTICDFFYVYQIGVALIEELEKLKIEQKNTMFRVEQSDVGLMLINRQAVSLHY